MLGRKGNLQSSSNKSSASLRVDEYREIAQVMKKYDMTSSNYDELYGEEQAEKYHVISNLIVNVAGLLGGKMLDAGGGTGTFYEYLYLQGLIGRNSYYVLFDMSIGMLERARLRISKLLKYNTPLVDIVRGDLAFLPFRGSSFDNIFSITVFNNLPQHAVERALEALLSSSRGDVIISALNAAAPVIEIIGRRQDCEEKGNAVKDIVFLCRNRPLE